MITGERIRWARKRVGLTQEQLALKVGITKSTVSSLELGNSKKPSAENLLPLASALNVDANWLITGKGEPYPSKEGEVVGSAAIYDISPNIFFPRSLREVNLEMIEDVAQRLAVEIDVPIAKLRLLLQEGIYGYFEKPSVKLSPAYINDSANIALQEIEKDKGFIFKGKDREKMLSRLKEEIEAAATNEEGGSGEGGEIDSAAPKVSNGN